MAEKSHNHGEKLGVEEAYSAAVAEMPIREEIINRKRDNTLAEGQEAELITAANTKSDQEVAALRAIGEVQKKITALAVRDQKALVAVREENTALAHRETISDQLTLDKKTKFKLWQANSKRKTLWLWGENLYDIDRVAEVVEKFGGRYLEKIHAGAVSGALFKSPETAARNRSSLARFGTFLSEGIQHNISIYNAFNEKEADAEKADGSIRHFSANDAEESVFGFVDSTAKHIGILAEQVGRGHFEAAISLLDSLKDDEYIQETKELVIDAKVDQADLILLNEIIIPARVDKKNQASIERLDALLAERGIFYIGEEQGYQQTVEVKDRFIWNEEKRRYVVYVPEKKK